MSGQLLLKVLQDIEQIVNERDDLLAFAEWATGRIAELEQHSCPEVGPERPNRRKLTEQEVKDIREAYRGGMSQTALADNYGVNPATISRTVRGFYH